MLSERAWEQVECLFFRPIPSTLCLWIAIVNMMKQASACPTLCNSDIYRNQRFCTVSAFRPQLVCIPAICCNCCNCILEQDFHGVFAFIIPDLKPRRFGGHWHNRLLLIQFFWKGKRFSFPEFFKFQRSVPAR